MPGFEAELRRVVEQLEAAKERRDALIVRASEAGVSRRQVAEAVGLSPSRVQQILHERRR
jgi:DNA-directed RNA polymerase specialized sigma subunit